jgi:predicted ATPase
MAGSAELAIISGVSGSGKTTMANKLGAFVIANGGSFLSGKFDQMTIQSFSAIASAFDNFCSSLVFDCDTSSLIASKLRAALGSDLHFLAQMIPNLRLILNDEDASCDPIYNQDCVDAQQRLYYLLCQFVEVICTCLEGIIVLFIDDMQWADPASISIISHLLKTSRSMQGGKLFFLASCRDDEMTSDHPFRTMIESVSSFGFKTTEVKLGCMTKDTVNNVVSNLLHLSPRLVASLSDVVYHKTKGNPLFVSKMLRSLNREGLLRVSLTRHRWEWDEEKIQARKIPNDVASFFIDSISTHPVDVRLALCTLSCFGNSAHHEVLSAIETDLNLNLTESLNDAIAEGLLDKLGEKYCFCHDRIQEIDEQDRCMHHMNYGVRSMHSYY